MAGVNTGEITRKIEMNEAGSLSPKSQSTVSSIRHTAKGIQLSDEDAVTGSWPEGLFSSNSCAASPKGPPPGAWMGRQSL